MHFLGMGWTELVIILVIVLLIFGPKNLPKLGNAIGRTFKNLRKGMEDDDKKKGDAEAVDGQEVDAKAENEKKESE